MLIGCVIPLWYLHIAWASALLVLTTRAMREPFRVGRVTDLTPTLFYLLAFRYLNVLLGSAKEYEHDEWERFLLSSIHLTPRSTFKKFWIVLVASMKYLFAIWKVLIVPWTLQRGITAKLLSFLTKAI